MLGQKNLHIILSLDQNNKVFFIFKRVKTESGIFNTDNCQVIHPEWLLNELHSSSA